MGKFREPLSKYVMKFVMKSLHFPEIKQIQEYCHITALFNRMHLEINSVYSTEMQ